VTAGALDTYYTLQMPEMVVFNRLAFATRRAGDSESEPSVRAAVACTVLTSTTRTRITMTSSPSQLEISFAPYPYPSNLDSVIRPLAPSTSLQHRPYSTDLRRLILTGLPPPCDGPAPSLLVSDCRSSWPLYVLVLPGATHAQPTGSIRLGHFPPRFSLRLAHRRQYRQQLCNRTTTSSPTVVAKRGSLVFHLISV
jgi:hypothetical protein